MWEKKNLEKQFWEKKIGENRKNIEKTMLKKNISKFH